MTQTQQHRARSPSPHRGQRGFEHPVFTAAWTVGFIVLMLAIPWEELRGRFADLHTYQANFSRGIYRFNSPAGVLAWWQKEALWTWTIPKIAFAVGGFDRALWLATAFSVIATSTYVAVRSRSALYLPLLLSPAYVDLVYSQVRSAVAIALLYLALILLRRYRTAILGALAVLAAVFIHNFAIAVVALGLFFNLVQKLPERVRPRIRYALILGMIATVSLVLTEQRQSVLLALRDRRLLQRQDTSGLAATILMASLTLPVWLRPGELLKRLDVPLLATAGCLLVAFFVTGTQGGTRLMAFALPAMAVAVAHLPKGRVRSATYAYAMAAHALYFSVWLQP